METQTMPSKQVGSGTQLAKSFKQLKALQQLNLSQILSFQNSIESIRDELKDLSNSASKIIQKKLNTPKATKTRHAFNPSYESKKLQQYKDQKEKIFRQIDQTKALIQSLKLQQQPEIKSEIIKRQIKIKELTALSQRCAEEKKYVIEQLQTNKSKINSIKQSAYNKDLMENEKLLQECKKQKTSYEKKLNHITNQEILASLFVFQLNSKIETYDQAKNLQQTNGVSPQQINSLLTQINTIIGNRNEIEKEKNKEISQLRSQIVQLEQQNNTLTNNFRQVQGQIMKRGLQERFYKSKMQRVSKSTDFLNPNRQYSSVHAKKRIQKSQINTKFSTQAINKFVAQTKPIKLPRYKDNLIQIGSTQLNNQSKLLKDQQSDSQEVDKIHSVIFILSENKIVGLKTTYLNKQGKKIIGDLLSIDSLQKTVEKEILVKEIKEIQYPINSKHICLKVHKFNQSVETIGTEYYGATHKYNISLKNIKNVQLIVEKNKQGTFQKPKGIIISLQSKVQIDKSPKVQDVPSDSLAQSRDAVFLTSSPPNLKKRAQSIDSVSTSSKKVVLKSLKKQTQGNLDHRLLIRKKLV